ncbi:MAG: flagellar filament capping protein FliD [Pseudomonadales bacterium]|nr:flagellar filament capping protein FliD [Pseudomonadales bacterium]
MATITSAGTGSGIDVELLVETLTNAEREPVENRLNLREVQIQADVSAFNSLKGALTDLRSSLSGLSSTSSFASRSATSSDESIFTVSAGSGAVPGSTEIEVQRLASAHKLVSADYDDADTVVGQGDLTIAVGSESFTVTIDSSNSTLTGIRDAINDASDNTGVTASILTVDDEDNPGETVAKLVFSADETGEDSQLTITVTGDATGTDTDTDGLSNLVYEAGVTENLTELSAAEDALIAVDGFDASSSNNVFSGVIPGVTINVLSADLGTTYDLNVAYDKTAVKEKLQSFVDALNEYKNTYDYLTEVDLESKEAGLLTGDATARGINSQLIRTVSSLVSEGTGSYTTFASIGITITREGEYELDETELDEALNDDFDAVAELVSGDEGIINALDEKLDLFLQSGGLIASRNETFEDQLADIEEQRADLELRIDSVEGRLRQQFTNMDIIVAQFNSTGDFLTQQLESLNASKKK